MSTTFYFIDKHFPDVKLHERTLQWRSENQIKKVQNKKKFKDSLFIKLKNVTCVWDEWTIRHWLIKFGITKV